MATLSHEALRRAIFRFGGCDEYYCEMIHASSLIAGGQFEKYYISQGPEPEKMVWQLTDTSAEPLIKAASIVAPLGGIGIDINMGCPAPEIYKHGAGMMWMNKDLTETGRMLEKIAAVMQNQQHGADDSSAICRRLSVKCRLGEDDFTESGFFAFIDMLLSSGVTQIVLHPRTRKQKYPRPARWTYVQKLCEHITELGAKNPLDATAQNYIAHDCTMNDFSAQESCVQNTVSAHDCTPHHFSAQESYVQNTVSAHDCTPHDCSAQESCVQNTVSAHDCHMNDITKHISVIGNGDISSVESAKAALATAPAADGIMLARYAVQKPWLFAQIAHELNGMPFEKQTLDLYEFTEQYLSDIRECQPKEFWKTRTQRFFAYFCDNFSFGNYLKARMLHAENHTEQLQILKDYLEKQTNERFVSL